VQIQERELSDNLQLRRQQEEVKKVEQQIGELDTQLGGLDRRNLERERQTLLQKDEQLEADVKKQKQKT
jgi:hypothetical protein